MDDAVKLWYLENFNIFNVLSREDRKKIGGIACMMKLSRNQFFYFPHDGANCIYFLKQGKVKISRYNDDGREIIYYLLGPGEIFGEMALLEEGKRDEIAEAIEDTLVCYINTEDFNKILEMNSKLNFQVTKLIGLKLVKIRQRLESMWFKTTTERVKGFLKELAEQHGKQNGENIEVKLSLTHQDIANLTATNRQTVTTILRDLQKSDVIEYNRRKIYIKKLEALNFQA